jgi:hypothetical protein
MPDSGDGKYWRSSDFLQFEKMSWMQEKFSVVVCANVVCNLLLEGMRCTFWIQRCCTIYYYGILFRQSSELNLLQQCHQCIMSVPTSEIQSCWKQNTLLSFLLPKKSVVVWTKSELETTILLQYWIQQHITGQ